MQRFQKSLWAALCPAILLVSQATHAQTPLCCTTGQTRMECLEQKETYWNQGIVCRDAPQNPSLPANAATVTTAPFNQSPQNALLPLCCGRGQSRMECLEQREKYWNQGIACQELPSAPPALNSAGSSPPALQSVAPAPVNAGASAAVPAANTFGTAPQPAPARVDADGAPPASRTTPTTASAPIKAGTAATTPAAQPLPAKSDLPACCSKDQTRMDCLEQRERLLTMGIACQGGK